MRKDIVKGRKIERKKEDVGSRSALSGPQQVLIGSLLFLQLINLSFTALTGE